MSFVCVLQLDTRFPRFKGDIGNCASFTMSVRHEVITGAVPKSVVSADPQDWLAPFCSAARQAQADGAGLITTSCGFLAAYQEQMAAAVHIPVVCSNLLQLRALQQRYGVPAVGVLTISQQALTAPLRRYAGIAPETPVGEIGAGHFTEAILANQSDLDFDLAQGEVVAATQRLKQHAPAMQALLLECTNLGPYAPAIARECGLEVFDFVSWLEQIWKGLRYN